MAIRDKLDIIARLIQDRVKIAGEFNPEQCFEQIKQEFAKFNINATGYTFDKEHGIISVLYDLPEGTFYEFDTNKMKEEEAK